MGRAGRFGLLALLLLSAALLRGPHSFTPHPPEVARRLEAWLEAGGTMGLERVGVGHSPSGGLGLLAKGPLQAGDPALFVPERLHLRFGNTDAVRGTSYLSQLPGARELGAAAVAGCVPDEQSSFDLEPDLVLLALALLSEWRLQESSLWQPYIASLPATRSFGTSGSLDPAWLWPEEEREKLPPRLRDGAAALAAHVDAEYGKLLRILESNGDVAGQFATQAMRAGGIEGWRWARATVFSRNFQLEAGASLVPGCDHANHGQGCPEVSDIFIDEIGNGATVDVDRDIDAGEEMFISYGSQDQEDFLFTYGFNVDGN